MFDEDWTFCPSKNSLRYRLRLAWRRVFARKGPGWRCLQPPTKEEYWQIFFMYLPTGSCTDAQLYTLDKLRNEDLPLLIVCASPNPEAIPEDVRSNSDSLYWKNLDGFDFSGYAIGLNAVAEHSSGADVIVLNDSVFGPFKPLKTYLEAAKWDLTGFTAIAGGENHIQSFAFILKNVTSKRLEMLKDIFDMDRSWKKGWDVVICQELRMARVASKSMSVGSFLYLPSDSIDPTLSYPAEIIELGFPFLKKSLLTKHSWAGNGEFATQYLQQAGHPMQ